ncbi:hypothetical protein PCC21_025590 [Pectobacterium carotovorum subsp. carotovorum PCC21]|nr:hypothetical protein PCC21_025590 [Pectobacterium carotovorum subsp. carotovorum PCC21]
MVIDPEYEMIIIIILIKKVMINGQNVL